MKYFIFRKKDDYVLSQIGDGTKNEYKFAGVGDIEKYDLYPAYSENDTEINAFFKRHGLDKKDYVVRRMK